MSGMVVALIELNLELIVSKCLPAAMRSLHLQVSLSLSLLLEFFFYLLYMRARLENIMELINRVLLLLKTR